MLTKWAEVEEEVEWEVKLDAAPTRICTSKTEEDMITNMIEDTIDSSQSSMSLIHLPITTSKTTTQIAVMKHAKPIMVTISIFHKNDTNQLKDVP